MSEDDVLEEYFEDTQESDTPTAPVNPWVAALQSVPVSRSRGRYPS